MLVSVTEGIKNEQTFGSGAGHVGHAAENGFAVSQRLKQVSGDVLQ